MAVVINQGSAAESDPAVSFTMSLTVGWDLIPGGRKPVAGDLILLAVRKPGPEAVGPPGWTRLGEYPWTDDDGSERTAVVFWRIIGPCEPDPVFTAAGVQEWEILGQAITGYAPAGGSDFATIAPA